MKLIGKINSSWLIHSIYKHFKSKWRINVFKLMASFLNFCHNKMGVMLIINKNFDGGKDMLYLSLIQVPLWCQTSSMHACTSKCWTLLTNTGFCVCANACIKCMRYTYVYTCWGWRMPLLWFLGCHTPFVFVVVCLFTVSKQGVSLSWNSPSMLG